jgi:hypothetical protein
LRHDDPSWRRWRSWRRDFRRRTCRGDRIGSLRGGSRRLGSTHGLMRHGWRRLRSRLRRRDSHYTLMGYRWANLCARRWAWDGWLGHTRRNCRWPYFHASGRRPGNDRSSGRLGCDCRGGRRWGYHNPRLLPGLGNNPSRSGRRWSGRTLTLPTEVRPGLTGRTLCRSSIRGRWLDGRAGGRRNIRSMAGRSRTRNTRGWRRHAGRCGG